MPDMSVREVPAGPGTHPSSQAGITRLAVRVMEVTAAELGQGWIWAWS